MSTTKQTAAKNIIKRAAKFSNIEAAYRWASYGEKAMWVMMGNVGTYLVVRPVDAARLEKSGYEFANY